MLWLLPLLYATLVAAWSIEKGAVSVSGQGDVGDKVSLSTLTHPVELVGGRSLDVTFKVPETPLPRVVAVRLSADIQETLPEGDLINKIVLAKMRGNSAKAVIPHRVLPQELLNIPLQASALLSGNSGEAIEVKLFDLIAYGDDDTKVQPVQKVGRGTELASKDTISYTFRPAPRHVNPVIAMGFIAVIDVLFIGLISIWKSDLQVNAKLLQSPINASIILLVLSLEISFVGYYISWSIFTLLSIVALLLPALFFVANRSA